MEPFQVPLPLLKRSSFLNMYICLGGGGSQRLIREIGKSRAMEMILTGKNITAQEAEHYGKANRLPQEFFSLLSLSLGLVSRIVPGDKLMEEVLKTADAIASLSQPVSMYLLT